MAQRAPTATAATPLRQTRERARPARRSAARRRRSFAVGLLVALPLVATPAAHAAAPKAKVKPAKLTLAKLQVRSATVVVGGRVSLPSGLKGTAANRKRVRVVVSLSGGTGKPESFSARIDAHRRFAVTRETKLTGKLALAARVTVRGRTSGATLRRTLSVTRPAGPAATPGASSAAPTVTAPTPVAADAAPLTGLFRLDAGAQSKANGGFSGSYFRMAFPGGFLVNAGSTAVDQTYTLLRPGTDGGFRTGAYQEPPVPPFDGVVDADGILRGNARANRIVLPQTFFGRDFSIVTAASDPQYAVADPVTEIRQEGGRLGGQITAWNAQWNGQSFNQGTPKPVGAPAPALGPDTTTTPLSGTYDPRVGGSSSSGRA